MLRSVILWHSGSEAGTGSRPHRYAAASTKENRCAASLISEPDNSHFGGLYSRFCIRVAARRSHSDL